MIETRATVRSLASVGHAPAEGPLKKAKARRASHGGVLSSAPAEPPPTARSSRRSGPRKPAVPRQLTPQRSRMQQYNDSSKNCLSDDAPKRRSASADQDRRSSYASSIPRQRPSCGGVERQRSIANNSDCGRPLNSSRSICSRRSTCSSSFRDDPSRPAFITKSPRNVGERQGLWREPLRQNLSVSSHQIQSNWLSSLCEDKKDEDDRSDSLTRLSRSQSAPHQRSLLGLRGADETQSTVVSTTNPDRTLLNIARERPLESAREALQSARESARSALESARTSRRWLWERLPLDSARSSVDNSYAN